MNFLGPAAVPPRAVALDKPGYFVGRRALEREAREGPAWKLVGLEVDWDVANAHYTYLNEAVGASSSGDVVQAAPGLYEERVVLDKSISLLGATAAVNKNGYAVPPSYGWDTTVESVIRYPDPTGQPVDQVAVDIRTDNVTFKGFVVEILNARVNSDHLLRLDASIPGGTGTYLSNIVVEKAFLQTKRHD